MFSWKWNITTNCVSYQNISTLKHIILWTRASPLAFTLWNRTGLWTFLYKELSSSLNMFKNVLTFAQYMLPSSENTKGNSTDRHEIGALCLLLLVCSFVSVFFFFFVPSWFSLPGLHWSTRNLARCIPISQAGFLKFLGQYPQGHRNCGPQHDTR